MLSVLFTLASARIDVPTLEVKHKFVIGGEGGWDTLSLDHARHHLFVSRGTNVMVIDTNDGKIVGDIKNTPGVHGTAIDPDHNKGFVSCGRENSVAVVDLDTLNETARIKVGENPDVIQYEPVTQRVLCFNGKSNDCTVIDAASGKVEGTVKLDGKPEFAESDANGHVFVNIEDKSEITEFDAKSLTVIRSWPLAPGEEPTGLGFDPVLHRLYSACGNKMLVVSDSVAGKVVGTAPIGTGVDGAAFDPQFGFALTPNGQDGTLTVVKTDGMTFAVTQTLATMKSARTIAYDQASHTAYLMAAEFDTPKAGQRRGTMKPGTATIVVVGPKAS
jgi:DNA-binding beta-propeller fold protein YncE